MGAKASSIGAEDSGGMSAFATSNDPTSGRSHHTAGLLEEVSLENGGHHGYRHRSRSLSAVGHRTGGHPILFSTDDVGGLPDTINERPTGESSNRRRFVLRSSVPLQLLSINGIKCPFCSKTVLPDDVELHLVICMTKPKLTYNDDILSDDKGEECPICLDELNEGDAIARLPCLCIYHKRCIDDWFKINRSCPEHPAD